MGEWRYKTLEGVPFDLTINITPSFRSFMISMALAFEHIGVQASMDAGVLSEEEACDYLMSKYDGRRPSLWPLS